MLPWVDYNSWIEEKICIVFWFADGIHDLLLHICVLFFGCHWTAFTGNTLPDLRCSLFRIFTAVILSSCVLLGHSCWGRKSCSVLGLLLCAFAADINAVFVISNSVLLKY